MQERGNSRPFVLLFGEPLPPQERPACIYDPQEQRCILSAHHSLNAITVPTQDNSRSDYTPWTSDEGGP